MDINVAHMLEKRNAYKILVENPQGKRPLETHGRNEKIIRITKVGIAQSE
jgi:hypothetical protein